VSRIFGPKREVVAGGWKKSSIMRSFMIYTPLQIPFGQSVMRCAGYQCIQGFGGKI